MFVCCKCRFLTDSNKGASVRIHVAQNEVHEARSKTAETEFCHCFCLFYCLSCEWRDGVVDEKLNFILYWSVLKRRTLKMKITKHNVANISVNILNSAVTNIILIENLISAMHFFFSELDALWLSELSVPCHRESRSIN